jgi:hypothetical protein
MTTGVLPWGTLRANILLNTGFFETSSAIENNQMYVTAGNWDDAGLSVGMLQYNYGLADRASELFGHLLTNYETVVRNVFGAETAKFEEFKTVNLTYTRVNKVAWADGISNWQFDVNGNKIRTGDSGHKLIAPWADILGRLMQTPESKAKYYEMFDAYYLPLPLDLFKQLNCFSRASLASLVDLSTNRGRLYPVATLVRDFEIIDADTTLDEYAKETAKIQKINDRGNDNTNGINVTTWVERRTCMRNQGGTYFGSAYDPETQFDINQEPALPEKQKGFGNDVKFGTIDAKGLYLGTTPLKSIYVGATLVGNAEVIPYTTSKVPDTQFRINNNSYVGFESGAQTIAKGEKVWIDVQNWVACKIYYTVDGTTPTVNSPRYYDGIPFNTAGTFTLKCLAVSLSGVSEAVKTCTMTITNVPLTTISPTTAIQNTIPITVTLTTDEVGATIKYKLGTGATEYTYTGPFTVNQNSAGVASTQIKVTYWSIGATGTEPAKTMTYDTAGATPAQPVVTATAGASQVALDWADTANTTSYTVYRSTVLGTLGTAIAQYITPSTYTDTTAVNGTTYYYTVQAGNYGKATNSAQVTATPTGTAPPPTTGWRYVRYVGHGDQTGVTSRLVELQALEGSTNRLLNKTPLAGYTAPNQGTIGVATDGAKVHSAGYPLWWTAEGTPDLHYDLGANYMIDTINVTGYSPVADPRTTQFKIYVSTDNINWTQVVDYSANATNQPEAGFNFPVPQG